MPAGGIKINGNPLKRSLVRMRSRKTKKAQLPALCVTFGTYLFLVDCNFLHISDRNEKPRKKLI